MVATDGSALSSLASHRAIELALKLGSELTVVTIIPKLKHSLFEGSFSIPNNLKLELKSNLLNAANLIVFNVQKEAEKAGLFAKTLVVKSILVSDGLIQTAISKKIDLIVMASHGRNGVNRLLLGSETLQVLTHSKIDVLVLR
jgi:nucleotide-binding universal stress UspA family protein